MVAFTFAMIWIGVLLGQPAADPGGRCSAVAFVAIFPLTFVASTFVPTASLPGVLRTVAEWNPITAVAGGLRELFENPGGAPVTAADPWPLHHPIAYTLIWAVAITPRSARRLPCAPTSAPSPTRSLAPDEATALLRRRGRRRRAAGACRRRFQRLAEAAGNRDIRAIGVLQHAPAACCARGHA